MRERERECTFLVFRNVDEFWPPSPTTFEDNSAKPRQILLTLIITCRGTQCFSFRIKKIIYGKISEFN
jgi:hypothetical protein